MRNRGKGSRATSFFTFIFECLEKKLALVLMLGPCCGRQHRKYISYTSFLSTFSKETMCEWTNPSILLRNTPMFLLSTHHLIKEIMTCSASWRTDWPEEIFLFGWFSSHCQMKQSPKVKERCTHRSGFSFSSIQFSCLPPLLKCNQEWNGSICLFIAILECSNRLWWAPWREIKKHTIKKIVKWKEVVFKLSLTPLVT